MTKTCDGLDNDCDGRGRRAVSDWSGLPGRVRRLRQPERHVGLRQHPAHRRRHQGGPCRGQRSRLRQQRVDGCVREDRPVGGLSGRQDADGRRRAAGSSRTGALPLDLRFTLPSGEEAHTAQLLLVSNNPYQLARLRGGGTRERLDGGAFGIAYVQVDTAADAERLADLELTGRSSASRGGASGHPRSSRCVPAGRWRSGSTGRP